MLTAQVPPRRVALRALSFALKYRRQLFLSVVALVGRSACNLLVPLIPRELIDWAIPQKRIGLSLMLGASILVLSLLDGMFGVFQRWLVSTVGEGMVRDLRVALYSKYQRRSVSSLSTQKLGDGLSKLNNDVLGAQSVVMLAIGWLTTAALALAIIVTMAIMEWRLTILSAAVGPLLIVSSRLMSKRQRALSAEVLDANGALTAIAADTLNIAGALTVRACNRTEHELRRFDNAATRVCAGVIRRNLVNASFFAIAGGITAAGVAFVYGVGAVLAVRGAVTIGTIVAFVSYLNSLYSVLRELGNGPSDIVAALVSFERVFTVLDQPDDREDTATCEELPMLRGAVTVQDVCFAYEQPPLALQVAGEGKSASKADFPTQGGTAALALDHVSFAAQPGEMLAIVGESGSGKTTLSYLVSGLMTPSGGRILIDGHDSNEITRRSLYAQIGLVTQDPYLFHDTIEANIRYANPDASRSRLEDAARAANIHHCILGLPRGYQTVVGERGYCFSGGEKQRIALARVFLKDPAILILDEATSQLDAESEAAIENALSISFGGKTRIVIAHNFRTVFKADSVLVLKNGRVAEAGTHASLLRLRGTYYQMFVAQSASTQVALPPTPTIAMEVEAG
jgi:ATP-binding cassette subfamily B protein